MFIAHDIMNPNVLSVRVDTTINEVVHLLKQAHISGAPVVDDEQHLVGIITEYDLLGCIVRHNLKGMVGDVMSAEVVTVDIATPLDEIAELLLSVHWCRVPVTRDGKLVGIISCPDLVYVGNIRQQILDAHDRVPAPPADAHGNA
jgi:CBS domain-containing protein